MTDSTLFNFQKGGKGGKTPAATTATTTPAADATKTAGKGGKKGNALFISVILHEKCKNVQCHPYDALCYEKCCNVVYNTIFTQQVIKLYFEYELCILGLISPTIRLEKCNFIVVAYNIFHKKDIESMEIFLDLFHILVLRRKKKLIF